MEQKDREAKRRKLRRVQKTAAGKMSNPWAASAPSDRSAAYKRMYQGLNHLVKGFLDLCDQASSLLVMRELSADLANLMHCLRAASSSELFSEDLQILQDKFRLSKRTMSRLYQVAHKLFTNGHHEAASDAFYLMTLLNPRSHTYWLSLGIAEHKQRRYKEAVHAYNMATITDYENPVSYAYAAECFHFLGDKEQVAHNIAQAEKYQKKEHVELVQAIQKFKETRLQD